MKLSTREFLVFAHLYKCICIEYQYNVEHDSGSLLHGMKTSLSTKLEVHNISKCHHRRTKLRLNNMHKNMMKFGCVVFNARCYASTVLAIIMYLFVPSHRYCTKMAKHRITQATLHNSPGIPVF